MTPTTHILKPPIPGFPGHCENEHLCLAVAGALGIPVARSRVRRFGEETAIVVERYDRVKAGSRLARLHQEDFCQALGRSPLNKYESEGGPGCREIAGPIRSHSSRPGEDLRTFVKAIALNRVLGGTDAHARNFSLLIGAAGNTRLAPVYDLASALPYPGHYPPRLKVAMKVGGEARLGYIRDEVPSAVSQHQDGPSGEAVTGVGADVVDVTGVGDAECGHGRRVVCETLDEGDQRGRVGRGREVNGGNHDIVAAKPHLGSERLQGRAVEITAGGGHDPFHEVVRKVA